MPRAKESLMELAVARAGPALVMSRGKGRRPGLPGRRRVNGLQLDPALAALR